MNLRMLPLLFLFFCLQAYAQEESLNHKEWQNLTKYNLYEGVLSSTSGGQEKIMVQIIERINGTYFIGQWRGGKYFEYVSISISRNSIIMTELGYVSPMQGIGRLNDTTGEIHGNVTNGGVIGGTFHLTPVTINLSSMDLEQRLQAHWKTEQMAESVESQERRDNMKQELIEKHVLKSQIPVNAIPYAQPPRLRPKSFQMGLNPTQLNSAFPEIGLNGSSGSTVAPAVIQYLIERGVVLLRDAVPVAECAAALTTIMTVARYPRPEMTERMASPLHRHHLRMEPKDMLLRPALQAVLRAVFDILATMMTPESILVELAAMLTNPGATEQDWHQDSQKEKPMTAPLYSVFLFLTDVAASDGPFQAFPNTHRFGTGEVSGDRDDEALTFTAPAGSVLIYDSTILHRGSANIGKATRGVLMMSFMGAGYLDLDSPTFAILSEFLQPPRGPFSISNFSKFLGLGSCSDEEENCEAKVSKGFCESQPDDMWKRCKWSCRACSKELGFGDNAIDAQTHVSRRTSSDYHRFSGEWANQGSCRKVWRICRRSCRRAKGNKPRKHVDL